MDRPAPTLTMLLMLVNAVLILLGLLAFAWRSAGPAPPVPPTALARSDFEPVRPCPVLRDRAWTP